MDVIVCPQLSEETSLWQAEAAQHAAAVAGERQEREEAEARLVAAQEACTKIEREATTRAQTHKEEVRTELHTVQYCII